MESNGLVNNVIIKIFFALIYFKLTKNAKA